MKSKWNRWKLVHKETGLTFKQYIKKNKTINCHDGSIYYTSDDKIIPVLLESGVPAVYVSIDYYPYMFFLVNKEWSVVMKNKENEE